MEYGLQDRVALITGSSHGIGKAIALALAREGADIIISGRTLDALVSVRTELESFGRSVHSCYIDARDGQSVRFLFNNVVAKIGRLDILVNNVGGAETFGDFFTLTDADWKDAYDLNVMSMVYFSRAAIPWLRKSDSARIINIASLPAKQPGSFNPHYSAAKAAMLNINKHLANVLAKDNILVNAICPSTLRGGGWDRNVLHRAERGGITQAEAENIMIEEERKKSPLGKLGTLDDIAHLAIFLASSTNTYITGSVIDVDGGIRRSVT